MRSYLVGFVLFYLKFWAKVALLLNRPYVIGIAGSVGKSSTRNALYAVLRNNFTTKVVSGNSETGVPLGILGLEISGFDKKNWLSVLLKAPLKIKNLKKISYLIIEMGIDDPEPPKNMSYLLTIVKPDLSIDLNATATHTEQFEKLMTKNVSNPIEFLIKKIAQEDSKIITNGYTKIGIYNNDDQNLKEIIPKNSKNNQTLKLLTFGEEKTNSIYYDNYIINSNKTRYSYALNTKKGKRMLELSFRGILLSKESRESFASVILASRELGLKLSGIKEALEKNFTIPKGRSSLLNGIYNSTIIDSSYNSSKSTVFALLNLLKILRKKTGRKIVFVMGDMRELGNSAKAEHEEVAQKLVSIVDELYCVGPLTLEYVVPIVKNNLKKRNSVKRVEWYKNSIQAGLHLKETLPKNAIVLVKGSQNTIYLEEAIKFILENPLDAKLLTRQEDYWMEIKKEYFKV